MATPLWHVTHDNGLGDAPGRLWTNSWADCMSCSARWLATHPLACGDLICPHCNSPDTVREDVEYVAAARR